MKIFYNDNYTASDYAFDTTRKSRAIAQSLEVNPVDGAQIDDPADFFQDAEQAIKIIHSREYVNAVKTGTPVDLAESQGFSWDEKIYQMAVSHSAGLIAATRHVLDNGGTAGSLSSGLHHASYSSGKGFCTFNGLAAAAKYAQDAGVERTLLIDFDAHAGGGTWDIMSDYIPTATQIDVTCAAYDTYKPEGESSIWYIGDDEYLVAIDSALLYASKKLDDFDLIIYNAGMDPLNCGVSESKIRRREDKVRDFIGDTPAVFALAGGYTWGNKTMDDVVNWHRITVETWAGAEHPQTTIV